LLLQVVFIGWRDEPFLRTSRGGTITHKERKMKQLKKDLERLTKDLKNLQKKTEQMAKKVGKLGMTQGPKTRKKTAKKVARKKRPSRKAAQPTAIDLVFSIIKRSKKGVGTDTLKRKTGFDQVKVFNTINALKRKGMIKNAGRGVYIKA
jgi:predicted RNase H-like nuclease (RuvC/YqgF family)